MDSFNIEMASRLPVLAHLIRREALYTAGISTPLTLCADDQITSLLFLRISHIFYTLDKCFRFLVLRRMRHNRRKLTKKSLKTTVILI